MHRSGTSAVSNLLNQLGFDLCGEVLPPAPDNPNGYFEHAGVVTTHDDFLLQSGRSWSDPRPFLPANFNGVTADRIRRRLAELVDHDFHSSRRWVIKDPRLCRLFPLWQETFQALEGVEVTCLHVTRSPSAVARSLAERDGIGLEKALLLWLRHTLEAELATRDMSRVWLSWESFQRVPEETFHSVCERGNLYRVIDRQKLEAAISTVFRPEWIHHRSSDVDDEVINGAFPWIRSVQFAVDLLCDGEETEAQKIMDQVRGELATADSLMMSDPELWKNEAHLDRTFRTIKLIESLRLEIGVLKKQFGTLREEVAAFHKEDGQNQRLATLLTKALDVNRLLEEDVLESQRARDEAISYYTSSRSWRITAPLRRFVGACRTLLVRS